MDFDKEDPDLALSIPIKAIFEEFYCPICFNLITNCYMTQCGHNFCHECILQCLNLKHICPCCNKDAVVANLVKNHHFDKLISTFAEQKDIASKQYFEKLIKKPNLPNLTQSQEVLVNELSPIEVIFHKHMKRSLLAYEEYYREIHSKFEANINAIQQSFVAKMAAATNSFDKRLRKREKTNKPTDEVKQRHEKKIAKYQRENDEKIAQLQKSFDESTALLLQLYDSYMQNFAPTREFLPVVISISIPSKNVQFKKVSISRTDSIADIKIIVSRLMAESKNPITSWVNNTFVLKQVKKTNKRKEHFQHLHQEKKYLSWTNFVQYDAQQGSELIIKGDILLESDKPKSCFTVTFKKGDVVDYFRCKDCNINWICKECAFNCHKNHTVMDHIKNHKPSWNCCYCVKNKKCIIQNKTQKSTE